MVAVAASSHSRRQDQRVDRVVVAGGSRGDSESTTAVEEEEKRPGNTWSYCYTHFQVVGTQFFYTMPFNSHRTFCYIHRHPVLPTSFYLFHCLYYSSFFFCLLRCCWLLAYFLIPLLQGSSNGLFCLSFSFVHSLACQLLTRCTLAHTQRRPYYTFLSFASSFHFSPLMLPFLLYIMSFTLLLGIWFHFCA